MLLYKITWDWVIFWEQKFIFLWLWRSGNLKQAASTSGCLLRATVCFQDDSLAVYPLEGMTVESSWQLQLKGALPFTSSSVVRERITFITTVASYLNFLPKAMPFCCHKDMISLCDPGWFETRGPLAWAFSVLNLTGIIHLHQQSISLNAVLLKINFNSNLGAILETTAGIIFCQSSILVPKRSYSASKSLIFFILLMKKVVKTHRDFLAALQR